VDFEVPENNDWLAANQFTVCEGRNERRPDVVLFVNGLPVAVIELKNADWSRRHCSRRIHPIGRGWPPLQPSEALPQTVEHVVRASLGQCLIARAQRERRRLERLRKT
jgi:hypothetical protein